MIEQNRANTDHNFDNIKEPLDRAHSQTVLAEQEEPISIRGGLYLKPGDESLTSVGKTPLVQSTVIADPYERGYCGNLKAICCECKLEQ